VELDIDSEYELKEEQITSFRERGFVKLKEVLSPGVIAHFGAEFTEVVHAHNKQKTPMKDRNTYQQAFIQIGNLWQKSELVKRFVLGKRLPRIAAELLGTRGVRLYHDQALYKEGGGGFTPWHADEYYWPLATEKCCTVWIPLQATPLEMGPLAFAEGSHRFTYGRDLKISDESEAKIQKALSDESYPYVQEPFDLGEVSFHYGWTFHRAEGNQTDRPREVMTVIYMDVDMRLKEPENENQVRDREGCCPGVEVGEIIDSVENPVLYEERRVEG
jgi:ectoine hydroxylase-related dioxygenase (phytanoyl-CoA dioxygenase family)